jgi:NADH-quinone oxidoreductase subunit L
MKAPHIPAAIGRTLAPVVKVLENKYYLDWFNEHVLAAGARCWARACGRAATGA